MVSQILFAGQEDISFTWNGVNAVNTTSGYFRAGYSRYAISVNDDNNNATTSNASFIQTPMFASTSSFWVTGRLYTYTHNGGLGGPTTGAILFRLVDTNNIVRLRARTLGGSNNSILTFETMDASSTVVSLGTSSSGFSTNTLHRMDIFVNYSSSGQIVFYIDGVSVFSYSGNITTNSVTALTGVIFGNYVNSNWAAFEQDNTYWSEMIVSTRDTRSMSLITQTPTAVGNTDTFTSGAASNVSGNAISYVSPDYSLSASQIQEYKVAPSMPTTIAGSSVVSVVQHVMCMTFGTGPSHIQFMVRTGGADFNSSSIATSSASYGLLTNSWDVNPNTLAAWQTSDLLGFFPGFNLVASYTPSSTRTDSYNDWGVAFTFTGTTGTLVSSLGIWKVSGNTGNFVVRLVNAANTVLLATNTFSMAGLTSGQFNYASCTPLAALTNGAAYKLVANVPSGQTVNNATVTITLNNASSVNCVYSVPALGGGGGSTGGSDQMFIGLDFQVATIGGQLNMGYESIT